VLARESCRHLWEERRQLWFASEALNGSLFECFADWRVGRDLRPHVFATADRALDAKTVLRETACVMNRMNGFLSLWRQNDNCFLSFFRDRKRQQLIWTQEVTQEVVKRDENALQLDCHCIEFSGDDVIDDWIQDMNENRFDAKRSLARIRRSDWSHVDRFHRSHAHHNLFHAYADLHVRRGAFARLRATPDSSDVSCVVSSVAVRVVSARLDVKESKDGVLFVKMALFDAKAGKVSQEFRFRDAVCDRTALYNVTPGGDLYLVVRVERCAHKTSLRPQSAHREPFAWSARPLFSADGALISGAISSPLFKMDSNRMSDDYVTQSLNNQNLMRNNTTLGGHLVVNLELDSSPDSTAARAVPSLRPPVAPVDAFRHVLYVFPLSLR
jgi:hypothetical protein